LVENWGVGDRVTPSTIEEPKFSDMGAICLEIWRQRARTWRKMGWKETS